MTIKINPKYESLRKFVEHLEEHFATDEGRLIHKGRNLVKVFRVEGYELNVKAYCVPRFFNQIVYRWLRKPKGLRAYINPQLLRAKGFESPEEVAYIEERCGLLMGRSYFVSIQCPYSRNFYEFGDANASASADIIQAFAVYAARLHEAGILHRDFSPGNILFDKLGDHYHFSLVDTNRMQFGTVSVQAGCANFARLWGQKTFFEILAKAYAKERGVNEAWCKSLMMKYRRIFWTRFSRRHKVKYHLDL
ncbi:MAG: lipopolysaccharide kinase InaA family protein [Bacteroidaceae bacterium]